MELLYHYLWKYRIFPDTMRLCDGRAVRVKSPGLHNRDSGPDFSHARICVDDTDWVGNVEIHVKASDWYRHGHQDDPAYDNIILHAVAVDDARITRPDGSEIPQLVIPATPDLFQVYSELSRHIDDVRCLDRLHTLAPLTVTDWMETLSVERLQMKAQRIKDIYRQFQSDWSQALFITLARSLGFGLNGVPFEMLGKSLPLKYVFRHGDNPMQVEALLFGQAGMLDPSINIFDDYYQALCREYFFLARKYGLRPLAAGLWKTSTRPANSPQRRIAILSAALTTGFSLFDKLLECRGDADRLRELFVWEAGQYWKEHTLFGLSGTLPTKLAFGSVTSLLINLAAPFYTAYASVCGEPEWAERSIDLLMSLPGEENSKTRQWKLGGLSYPDALRSQALIQLRNEYCDRCRCLECRFGHTILRTAANGEQARIAMEPGAALEQRKKITAVVAMDSWKGCLDADQASAAVAEGLISEGYSVIELPMADGGEGTAAILGKTLGLKRLTARVSDPLYRTITAEYYLDPEKATAYIDFAAASGLTLLKEEERNPWVTSSYGTGGLILAAKAAGARHIVLGLGGSATVDGALGTLAALGAKIYDNEGELIKHPCGSDLERISRIEPVDIGVSLTLLTDVDSPLTGEKGAAMIFAPQKGADPAMTHRLEDGMKRLGNLMQGAAATPGYGAAGGAGGGLAVFAGGEITPGAEFIARTIGLDEALRDATIAVTGEGRADRQTLMGKVPATILAHARRLGIPTILMAGIVEDRDTLERGGFGRIIDINAPYPFHPGIDPMNPATARARLRTAAYRVKSKAAKKPE